MDTLFVLLHLLLLGTYYRNALKIVIATLSSSYVGSSVVQMLHIHLNIPKPYIQKSNIIIKTKLNPNALSLHNTWFTSHISV